jgi:tetratricopeptide (TPR) repeat protein
MLIEVYTPHSVRNIRRHLSFPSLFSSRSFCLLFILVRVFTASSQSKADSLLRLREPTDTSAINAMLDLSEAYAGRNPDTSLFLGRRALSSARRIKNKILELYGCTQVGHCYSAISQFDSSLSYHQKALALGLALNRKRQIASSLHNIGKSYQYLDEYEKAISYYYRALKINEEQNNQLWKSYNLIGIGGVYNFMGKDEKAIDSYRKALSILEKIKDEQGVAYCLNNIGLMYNRLENYREAIGFLEKAYMLNTRLGNEQIAATNLGNLGVSWYNLEDYNKALQYYSDAMAIAQKTQDRESVAIYLNNMANVFSKLKRFDKALHFGERSLALATELKIKHQAKTSLLSLILFNRTIKNFEKASNYQLELKDLLDSLYTDNENRTILEIETKYQTEKREKENLLLRQQQEIASEKEKKQRVISISITGGLIVVIFFAIFIANRLKISNRQKKTIEHQKHLVDEKQKEILDSIKYAKRLQEAILPPVGFVNEHLPENFIFYQPKDIVAGDFYWMECVSSELGVRGSHSGAGSPAGEPGSLSQHPTPNSEQILLAAADCTGHGVPGAMVSVVCSTALNRSVHEFGLTDPGKILDKTRELVLETFSRSDTDVQDGMDISLISIQKRESQNSKGEIIVRWSGANNPLWYLQGGVMKDIAPNKQSIGKTERPLPFTTHTVELRKGDILYLFTDGYADQFGGPKGKKFKYKSLKELLYRANDLPMKEQKEVLYNTLSTWKGELEQVDDICVIGVRV